MLELKIPVLERCHDRPSTSGFASRRKSDIARSSGAGVGAEWAFAPHWSVNVEYNYYDFGTQGMVLTNPINTVSIAGIKDTIHTGTVGVNYHF